MEAPTMGQRNNIDEPTIALIAGVFRQAAWDYRYAVKWLAAHPRISTQSKAYKSAVRLRNDVKRFTKSQLFDMVLGDVVEPDVFLKMALKGQIRMSLKE
jgi:hypothetical protein